MKKKKKTSKNTATILSFANTVAAVGTFVFELIKFFIKRE